MAWPLASQFSAMVQNPQVAFRDPQLRACQIERDSLRQPRVWAGSFAVVYKGTEPSGKAIAIRAFTTESAERRDRYYRISEYLRDRKPRCLVDFEYRDDAIRSAGDGKWYPLVVMDWVEGKTLYDWVRGKCLASKSGSLEKAVRHWIALVNQLRDARIAHGDLQHGNVLVTRKGELKLVDYDGMCVPALVDQQNLETGITPYQHPQRNSDTPLSLRLDNFSALVIYVALKALTVDPSLWNRYVDTVGNDKLLFSTDEFTAEEPSELRNDLAKCPDRDVRLAADALFSLAQGNLNDVPPLHEIVSLRSAARAPRASATPKQRPDGKQQPATSVHLEVISGPLLGREFEIDRHDTLIIGRAADCHIPLEGDLRVSRHHLILEANPPDVCIRDLGSRNGTHVNGKKYGGRNRQETPEEAACRRFPTVDVEHGDQISIGQTTIRVRVHVPRACSHCGELMPDDDLRPDESNRSSPVCAACRQKVDVGSDIARPIRTVRCQCCGADISHEMRNGRCGEYICQSCQTEAFANAGGLRTILQNLPGNVPNTPRWKIEGYEVGEELERNSASVLHAAIRESDGRPMAICIMLSRVPVNQTNRDEFFQQIEPLRDLRHPHIARLWDFGSIRSAFYFVIDPCEGDSLSKRMAKRGGRLPQSEARPLMLQCLDALDYAHRRDIIHRDLRPDNFFVCAESSGPSVRIARFGFSFHFQRAGFSGMTMTRRQHAQYEFMAPEFLRATNSSQKAGDLWCLAANFYHMLTGKFAMEFGERHPIDVILNDEHVPLRRRDTSISTAVADVIDRALSIDVTRRYATASDFKAALEEAYATVDRLR